MYQTIVKHIILFFIVISQISIANALELKTNQISWEKITITENKVVYLTKSLGRDGLNMLWDQLDFTSQEIPQLIINLSPMGYTSNYLDIPGASLQEYLWAQERGIEYHTCFDQDGFYLDAEHLLSPQENIDIPEWIQGEAQSLIKLREDPAFDGGIRDLNILISYIQNSSAKTILIHDWNGRQANRILKLAFAKLKQGSNAIGAEDALYHVWPTNWEFPMQLTKEEYIAYLKGPYDFSPSVIYGMRNWPNLSPL